MNSRTRSNGCARAALACLAAGLLAGATLAAPGAPDPSAPVTPRAGNPHGDMSLDCRLCHNAQDPANTQVINFDHAATGFVLEGQHARVACRDCHRQPQFSHIGTRCSDCHQDAHQARLGPACEQCHTPDGWVERTVAQRDHDNTRLPLVGAHAKVDCDACHTGAVRGTYVGTPFECYACHQADFEATRSPDHRTAGFTTDCNRCHGVFSASWGRGDFIHSLNFPLTGGHATAVCAACHADRFAGTPTDCYGCHQANYDGSVNPPHATANLGTGCVMCHTTAAWRPSSYDHATTGYALEGRHRQVTCTACHQVVYTGTSTDCYACHRPDYENVLDPNHVTGGFPIGCIVCHTPAGWNPSTFDHARTAFALTGAHAALVCTQCHASGYAGTPTDCYACHRVNYEATTNPNHATSNIPATCAICHSTTAWSPAQFNHNTTSFPLTGAHAAQACAACHAAGYAGTPTDCYACHRPAYDQTTNPGHAAASFPVTCATCHSTAAWVPSTWNHEAYFPIAAGTHSIFACAQCHVTPAGYAAFECILCHEHNQTDMDAKHSGRPNYQWVSSACYNCHPRGRP